MSWPLRRSLDSERLVAVVVVHVFVVVVSSPTGGTTGGAAGADGAAGGAGGAAGGAARVTRRVFRGARARHDGSAVGAAPGVQEPPTLCLEGQTQPHQHLCQASLEGRGLVLASEAATLWARPVVRRAAASLEPCLEKP